ncbi:AsnC family transcriptional regulator [Candidatus Micrarchaeota archaeon]|nr:AsnC family transcriptional regulator [Candidatus Micrarchaeota archaeon]
MVKITPYTKLDLIDRKILTELDKNCRISDTKLAKKVGRSREAVKYRIKELVQKGFITGFITSINPNKMGYYFFKIYLRLRNIPGEREKFFEYLKNQKEIYWLGISDGAFDCVFAYLSKSITNYYDEINILLSKFEPLIVERVLGLMVDTHQYNKKFFLENTKNQTVVFAGDVVDNEIDETDQKIIEVLANDARISILQLSRRINSSPDRVKRKIERMEKLGIILSYRVSVDLNKLGHEFFKAIIYFKALSKKEEESLFAWMSTHPNSVYYIRSLAPWQAEFEFVVKNYQEFNQIINSLRKNFPKVISHYEHLIMIYEAWMPAHYFSK